MPALSWPLLVICFFYTLGIVLSNFVFLNFNTGFFILFLIFLSAFLYLKRRIFYPAIIFSFFWIGFLRGNLEEHRLQVLKKIRGYEGIEVKGYLSSIPVRKYEKLQYTFKITEIGQEKLPYKTKVLVVSEQNELEPGDFILLRCRIKQIRSKILFYVQDYCRIKKSFSFIKYLYKIKKFTDNVISNLYPKSYSAYAKAIILGDIEQGLDELRHIFQRIGIAHILAISGLHVGLIIFSFHFIFKTLGIYGRLRLIILLLVVFSYMLITGARPPVLRASLMAVIYIYFWFFYIKPNPFNVLFLSAFLILIFSPHSLYQVSFQLSFSAITGIFIFFYLFPSKSGFQPLTKFIDYLKVASGSWLFVSPLICYYWAGISIINLASNVILLPIFSLIMVCVFSSVLCSFVSLSLAKFFATASYPLLYLIYKFSYWANELPFCYIKVPKISVLTLLVIYCALFVIIFLIRGIINRKNLPSDVKNV